VSASRAIALAQYPTTSGVAEGVEGLNKELRWRLEACEKDLAAKTQQLEDANRRLEALQRKLDAIQP